MHDDDARFADLLRQVVPEPEVAVGFDELAEVRRRRRRTSALIAAAAAAALAIAVPLVWSTSGSRDTDGTVLAKPSSRPTAIASSDGRCPPTEPRRGGVVVMVDYVDFVQHDGRQYLSQGPEKVTPAELGFPVGEVTCEISTLTKPGDRRIVGPFLDGNAAYLPAGTVLQAVSGYDASCRIAAVVDAQVRVYLAQEEGGTVSTPRPCALTPSADARVVTRCEKLPPVPDGEVDSKIDLEHEVLEYTSGHDNATFTINYGADPTCIHRADVRRLVQRSDPGFGAVG